MNKLKIALVLDDGMDSPDGVQQYVRTLGQWLTDQGHAVHYLVGETTRTDIPNLQSVARNVRVKFNGNRLSIPLPVSAHRVRELLGEETYDVVHVNVPYSPLFAGRLIRRLPATTAVVGTFHVLPYGMLERLANRLLALWCARTDRRFDAMIASTQPTAAFACQVYGFEPVIIPHPFELSKFQVAAVSNKIPTIVYLGRLVERKGPLELLLAVARLKEQGLYTKPFKVVIGGKGPLLERLQQYVEQVGLGDCVTFAGFVAEDAKSTFLAQGDVTAFPSISGESFGISLLEGLAASSGVVLGGDNPGYRAVLSPLNQDRLFDPRNTDDFATKLATWLSDPLARQQAAKAQKQYVQRFAIDTVGTAVTRIYDQALRTRRNVQ